MTSGALVILVALLAAGAQAAMTSVSPVASKAKANQRSTKAAPGEDETHLLVYKVRPQRAYVSYMPQQLHASRRLPFDRTEVATVWRNLVCRQT